MSRAICSALLATTLLIPAERAAAQGCYMVRDRDTALVVSNPFTTVEFPSGQQFVRVHWSTGATTRDIDIYPGFPTQGFLCPARPMERDLNFDASPRKGITFQWWSTDARNPVPHGGPQDAAVRAWLVSTLSLPALPRRDQPQPDHPERMLPYHALDYATLNGDTVRIGTTVRVTDGKDEVLASISWILARPGAKVAVASPPKPADPCAAAERAAAVRPEGPNLQSAGATGASGGAVRVEPPRQTFRARLATALGCYSQAQPLLRAFYGRGVFSSGVDDQLAQQLLPTVTPRGQAPADQQAQLVALHETLLVKADASKVVRELFAERAPGAPLVGIEDELVPGTFRASTWTEALQRMDRHLATGARDAMAEARTEATLFMLTRRGEWTNVMVVQTLAAFAPPLVAATVGLVAPLYDDLPATASVPRPLDEAAPEYVAYALDQSKQLLDLFETLGAPGVADVAASAGRIKAGVKLASAKGTPLEVLEAALDALPEDATSKLAKQRFGDLTKLYGRLATAAGELDRLIGNARYEAALQHFAERNASLPSIQGWIGATGDEVKRTTASMVARRDTVRLLRAGVERRFGRPFERLVEECTPNLDCFTAFADFKVRIEQQQFHIAHLIDERAANLIEQRALCWRLNQRGGWLPVCGPAPRG
jgi:hypothetical protein